MKKAALVFTATILMAGLAQAQEAATTKQLTGADELVKKSGPYQETWVRPDSDMSRYSKLHMWEPEFQFRPGGDTSSGTTLNLMRDESGPYAIREESKEKFKQVVSDAFVKELARSKLFEVTDAVGPGTLIVHSAVLDIISNVPPNIRVSGELYLASVGEATIVFELIDAETGVIQARVAERRIIQPEVRLNRVNDAPVNSATVWNDVERWAHDQARNLRKALEKAKKKAGK